MSPRLSFRNPPVHEVILTLQFQARVDLRELDRAADLLSEPFLAPERAESSTVELVGTPTGEAGVRMRREAVGWAFKNHGPTKVVHASRDALTVHCVRPGRWPIGPYPGWDVNGPWAFGVFRELAPIYATVGTRRAALRYLNRIAIPAGTQLREWFTIVPPAPTGVSEMTTFSFGQTWERVADADDIGVTVRLLKIAIDEPDVQQGNEGALLDIEVFNRRGVKGPSFDVVPDWFNSAHRVENEIFDSCITPKLADTFGRDQA